MRNTAIGFGVFLVVFLVPACVYGAPDFTVEGYEVFVNTADPVKKEEVRRIVEIQREEVARHWGMSVAEVADVLDTKLSITFVDDCAEMLRGCRDDGLPYYLGLYVFPDVIRVYRGDGWTCLPETSLGHELTHFAQWQIDHTMDDTHLTEGLWNGPDSITMATMYRGREEMCR